jgi:hypothetical protein
MAHLRVAPPPQKKKNSSAGAQLPLSFFACFSFGQRNNYHLSFLKDNLMEERLFLTLYKASALNISFFRVSIIEKSFNVKKILILSMHLFFALCLFRITVEAAESR